MKVGLFFGSFNPIHTGHLILAQTALNLTPVEAVWLIVSPQNPLKKKRNLLPEYDRLRMAELAVEDNERLLASNVEFGLPKPSYTIDTLTHLSDTYRSYEFSLIMGEDNLEQLPRWKNYEALLKYYRLYVYPRGEKRSQAFMDHEHVHRFEAPLLNISATYIRENVRAGRPVRYLVPDPVFDYIEKNRMFR